MWAQTKSGLNDIRDLREIQTLARAFDHIQLNEVAQALDVLTARIQAIQIAKMKGSSWEKAERGELLPMGGTVVAPSGVLSLTQ